MGATVFVVVKIQSARSLNEEKSGQCEANKNEAVLPAARNHVLRRPVKRSRL